MSNRPDYNYPLFNKIAQELRSRHHEVCNPAELDQEEPGMLTWEEYLRRDIKVMLDYDVIVLLPEWETSRGARFEVNVGDVLQMYIFELDVETFDFKPTKYGNQNLTAVPV